MTLRLHLNENTAGCSPAVLAALRSMTAEDMGFYPDYTAVTADCARALDVPPEWAVLTNGLDDGLHAAAVTIARETTPGVVSAGNDNSSSHFPAKRLPGSFQAVVVEPAFEMFALNVRGVGGEVVTILSGPDFAFPQQEITAALSRGARLLYLCNPNNPTGLLLPDHAVEEIAAAAPHALVVVDEAYADFSGVTSIGPVLDRCRNVIVGRTFSKAHGLAGLRAGVLVGHPDALARIRPSLQPFTLNVCAAHAVRAALADLSHFDWYVAQAATSRRLIENFCRRQNLKFWSSQANFVLVRVGDPKPLVASLASRGILIRDRSDRPGCDGCIRITAGVVSATEQCLTAMEDYFASRSR